MGSPRPPGTGRFAVTSPGAILAILALADFAGLRTGLLVSTTTLVLGALAALLAIPGSRRLVASRAAATSMTS